jgi:hypothetical protein
MVERTKVHVSIAVICRLHEVFDSALRWVTSDHVFGSTFTLTSRALPHGTLPLEYLRSIQLQLIAVPWQLELTKPNRRGTVVAWS